MRRRILLGGSASGMGQLSGYGRAHLTRQDLSYMEALPTTACIHIVGMNDIRICHGIQRAVRNCEKITFQ